ncbi:hypothetical protein FRC01_005021 [Tulasnella sp. 417]|nr:hypothetical protein FRC01_005021 [Tulasnella sp. 417]
MDKRKMSLDLPKSRPPYFHGAEESSEPVPILDEAPTPLTATSRHERQERSDHSAQHGREFSSDSILSPRISPLYFPSDPTVGGRPPIRPRPTRSSTTVAPYSESGLSHIDIPRKFGDAAEFWRCYDELADRHDKDTIKTLSDNLDILLIFAGLFSAVNTSFIIMSLTTLIQDPNAESTQLLKLIALGKTNLTTEELAPPSFSASSEAVSVNCFFAASLASSLLTAFGAVMAKQWVLHFARGKVGTLETQGRHRQLKLNGSLKWRFENVVEALPVLLQVSLICFFIGLLMFLKSMNMMVAWTVFSFCMAGVVVYCFTVFVATVDEQCPFQTPVSTFFRKAFREVRRWYGGQQKSWRKVAKRVAARRSPTRQGSGVEHVGLSMAVGLAASAGGVAPGSLVIQAHKTVEDALGTANSKKPSRPGPSNDLQSNEKEAIIDNQTACWVIENSDHNVALIATARNIPALRKIEGTGLTLREPAFHRLITLFKESLTAWRASNTYGVNSSQLTALETALVYGRAVTHSVCGSHSGPEQIEPSPWRFQWPRWRKRSGAYDANELLLVKFCLTGEIPRDFCLFQERQSFPHASEALSIYMMSFLEPAPAKHDFRVHAWKMDRITMVLWLAYLSLTTPDALSQLVIGRVAWAMGEMPSMINGGKEQFADLSRAAWWNAYTSDEKIYENIVKALSMFSHYRRLSKAVSSPASPVDSDFALLVDSNAVAELYLVFVRNARSIIDAGSQYLDSLDKSTLELDSALRGMLLTIGNQDSAVGLSGQDQRRDALQDLRSEILLTMKSLRRDGVEAIIPKDPTFVETDAAEGSHPIQMDEDHSVARLRESPGLQLALIRAVLNKREGTRYAALSILHDYGLSWFDNDEDHNPFQRRTLVNSFDECLADKETGPENFELVCGIVAQLVTLDPWRRNIVEVYLDKFHERAKELLAQGPSLRRLEVYLDVWKACRQYPDCATFVAACETDEVLSLITVCLHNTTTHQLPPYIPQSVMDFVNVIHRDRDEDHLPAQNLRRAFGSLEQAKDHTWWNLA